MKTSLKYTILVVFSFFITTKSFSQNGQITSLIEKKRQYNIKNGFKYKIQLFNGEEKKAKSIKSRFSKIYYWAKTTLEYDAPDWKVYVGKYQTKLEADRALNKFREKFRSAIIVNNK